MAFGHFKRLLGNESVIGTDKSLFKRVSDQAKRVANTSFDRMSNSVDSVIGTSREVQRTAVNARQILTSESGDALANSAESIIGTSRKALSDASSVLTQQIEKSGDILKQGVDAVLDEVVVTGNPLLESEKGFVDHTTSPRHRGPSGDLAARIHYSLARPNRYEVRISLPTILQSTSHSGSYMRILSSQMQSAIKNTDTLQRLMFTCETAALPGKSVNTTDARTYGPIRKYPYDVSYLDLSLTFMVGQDMLEKKFFEAWNHSIFDPVTHNFNYQSEYTADIDIYQLDTAGNIVYGVKCLEAYPTTIGDMSLGYAETDSYHKLNVTFTLRRWVELIPETARAEIERTATTSKQLHGVSNPGNNDMTQTAAPGFHWDPATSSQQPNS